MPNIIYILTNEVMPGLVKIGFTGDLEERIRALSSATGVRLPFECYYAVEVPDHVRVENILHNLFADHRVNPRREFFEIEPEKAVLALSIGGFKEVTLGDVVEDAEEQAALDRVRSRRPRISLAAIDILPGALLSFSRDSDRTVLVMDGNKVTLDGEVMTLSRAAITVLQEKGYQTTHASGSQYWMYRGETLDERRERMEKEKFNRDEED